MKTNFCKSDAPSLAMHTPKIDLKIDPSSVELQHWYKMLHLWNDWNPMKVASEDIQDEYAAYISSTLTLLEDGCTAEEIEAFLSTIVRDYIGLGDEGVRESNPGAFAQKIMAWYQGNR